MNLTKFVILIACISLFATGLYAAPQAVKTTTYMGYNPQTGRNDLPQSIMYQFPDAATFGYGPFPLFIWSPGTLEPYQDALALASVTMMANRGFVGASVQYNNTMVMQQTCSGYQKRALGVFEVSRATSAVSTLCSISGVSCGKGIVTAGVSQGAALAILAKNYAPNVAATYAMSMGDFNSLGIGVPLSCMDYRSTAIPSNRLMVVNGQNDPSFAGQTPAENVSGFSCPSGSSQCWSPEGNGAGWYIVQNSQTSDNNADHCYMLTKGCGFPMLETDWISPAGYNWSLMNNLDWLASFGTHRNFSPTGR